MKKITSLAVFFTLFLMMLLPSGALADQKVKVTVDGEELIFDVDPVINNDRTLLPLRGIAETLGAIISWDEETKTVSLEKLGRTVELQIGNEFALVNGLEVALDEPAQIINRRTLVPARFITEIFGGNVYWNQETRTVSIISLENWLLEKSVSIDLNSYSMELMMDQQMTFGGETESISMKMDADMIVNPLQMYSKTIMEMMGFTMVSEEYLTEEGYFILDPSMGEWVKYPEEMINDLIEFSNSLNNDPLAQMGLMINYVESITAVETDNYYVLEMTISNEGFMAMMTEMLEMLAGLAPDENLEELLSSFTINTFEFTTLYDKETFFPLAIEGTTEMVMNIEGDEMLLFQTITGQYSNFNNVEEIIVPKEVIENATNLEDLDFEGLLE